MRVWVDPSVFSLGCVQWLLSERHGSFRRWFAGDGAGPMPCGSGLGDAMRQATIRFGERTSKVYVYSPGWRGNAWYVFGHQFGPVCVIRAASFQDALDEWDERHGTRVDVADPALGDYPGGTLEERIESAIEAGDVRVNDGGTIVWVDPYEWMSERHTRRFKRG